MAKDPGMRGKVQAVIVSLRVLLSICFFVSFIWRSFIIFFFLYVFNCDTVKCNA